MSIVEKLDNFFDGTKSWKVAREVFPEHYDLLVVAEELWRNYPDKNARDADLFKQILKTAYVQTESKLGRALK